MVIPIAIVDAFFQAYRVSDIFGKLIFISLFALSCLSWIIIIQKMRYYKRIRKLNSEFDHAIQKHKDSLLKISKDAFPKYQMQETPHPFAKLFFTLKQKTLEILDKNHTYGISLAEGEEKTKRFAYLSTGDIQHVQSYMEIGVLKEGKDLEKNLFILSTTVTLAPFLGLLGTVWGILIAFSEFQKGFSTHSSSLILGGLSTALTTTVLGLVIAIPALVGYNYLKNSVKAFITEMDLFSNNLLSIIELQYRKVDHL